MVRVRFQPDAICGLSLFLVLALLGRFFSGFPGFRVSGFPGFRVSPNFNRPRSIYQYSNMAPRLSSQTSIFGVVVIVSKSLLGIEGQTKHEKFAIVTRKRRSNARILIYRTWPIRPG